MTRYYCLICNTTHSEVSDNYQKHLKYAFYPEEFGIKTVKETRQFLKYLKPLISSEFFPILFSLQPGKYAIYSPLTSVRNLIYTMLKSKIAGKPTFVERGNELVNKNLSLSFEIIPYSYPNMDCYQIDLVKVCIQRIATFEQKGSKKEEVKEKVDSIEKIIEDIIRYENLAYILGYDKRLSRDEYYNLVSPRPDYKLLKKTLKKLRNMYSKRFRLYTYLNRLFEQYATFSHGHPDFRKFRWVAINRLTYYGYPLSFAKKVTARYVFVKTLEIAPKYVFKNFKDFVFNTMGYQDETVRDIINELSPWSIWIQRVYNEVS